MNYLATFSTEELLHELIRRRRTYIAQLDRVLAAWGADVSDATKAAFAHAVRDKTAMYAPGASRGRPTAASRSSSPPTESPRRRALRGALGRKPSADERRRDGRTGGGDRRGAKQARPLPSPPQAWASAAVTDPELLLAAFDNAEPPPSDLRTRPSSDAPPASTPISSSSAPTEQVGPALRENEVAVRTPGGGVVIRRKRTDVAAS